MASSEAQIARRHNRTFILSSMSVGHGIEHLFDQGLPVLMPTISSLVEYSSVGGACLSFRWIWNRQPRRRLGCRYAEAVLGYDAGRMYVWRRRSICFGRHITEFPHFVGHDIFRFDPWSFVASACCGFTVSVIPRPTRLGDLHPRFRSQFGECGGADYGSSDSRVGSWRSVLFIYAVPAVMMGVFVWWSLRDIGKGGDDPPTEFSAHLRDTFRIMKNPVVLLLVVAAILRGIGLDAVFAWSPFYLEEELGKGHLSAGIHYSLLTGMGIISAPVMGMISDRFGRKSVLVPGFLLAAIFSLVTVIAGDGIMLLVVFSGMGLFSFALHQIIQAAVLDVVGKGTEAAAVGLIFGINGILGAASPFLGFLVIDNFGGYGAVYYYAGILTALSALLTLFAPMKMAPRQMA